MKRLSLLAVIGAALVAVLALMWQSRDSAGPSTFELLVRSADQGKPIPGAKVKLSFQDGGMEVTADSDGLARFRFQRSARFLKVRVLASAEGFKDAQQLVEIPSTEYRYTVSLPARQTPEAAPEAAFRKTFSSGGRPSGIGKEFSQFYQVSSDPPPPGYQIDHDSPETAFRLSGDRSCGGWSICRWSVKTDKLVVFEFSLQGHDEWFPPRPAYSEGILEVRYVPVQGNAR